MSFGAIRLMKRAGVSHDLSHGCSLLTEPCGRPAVVDDVRRRGAGGEPSAMTRSLTCRAWGAEGRAFGSCGIAPGSVGTFRTMDSIQASLCCVQIIERIRSLIGQSNPVTWPVGSTSQSA